MDAVASIGAGIADISNAIEHNNPEVVEHLPARSAADLIVVVWFYLFLDFVIMVGCVLARFSAVETIG